MKVLLLGEFSGLYKNLKEGLIENGVEAVVASGGDGFKKIQCDIDIGTNLPGVIGAIHKKLKPMYKIGEFKNYDVVQLINPFLFYNPLFSSMYCFRKLKDANGKFFMSAAGDDSFFWRYSKEALAYGPFNDYLLYDLKRKSYYMESQKCYDFNSDAVAISDGIIPIMYEYEVAYKNHSKLLNTIPIPINVDRVAYEENRINKRLVVFHGLNRYGFKGTRHIEKAFSVLKDRYPNDLDLVISGHMPLHEYLKLMARTNIVIDQANSYSCGVNAIYAMAMGKVVLGGAEPESLHCLGVTDSPVVNIKPDYRSIVVEIEKLLDCRHAVTELGERSRAFCETNHSHRLVAKKYIDTWKLS